MSGARTRGARPALFTNVRVYVRCFDLDQVIHRSGRPKLAPWRAADLAAIRADFPDIGKAGIFSHSALSCGPDDLDDFIGGIPPNGGTLASFPKAANFWHGHAPYAGERCYVMFDCMTSDASRQREFGRHCFSVKLKRFNPFA